MFDRKFWHRAGEAFLVAFATVLVTDGTDVLTQPSWATAVPALAALGRAAAVAGLRAVAPLVMSRKEDPNG